MTILSTKTLSDLGYSLPDDVAPLVREINHRGEGDAALIAEAQEAIDGFATTMDAELSDSGHYARGQLSEEACGDAETRLRKAITALNGTLCLPSEEQ